MLVSIVVPKIAPVQVPMLVEIGLGNTEQQSQGVLVLFWFGWDFFNL